MYPPSHQRNAALGTSSIAFTIALQLSLLPGCASSPTSPPGVRSEPEGRRAAAAQQQDLAVTRKWISEVLAQAEGQNQQPSPTVQDWSFGGVITEQEIFLFIHAGQAVIPDLIQHVRDRRETRRYWAYPLRSGVELTPKMMGEVACYMIEAILRQNPYFTTTGHLRYRHPADSEPDLPQSDALDQTATAYEAWYRRCFDADKGTIRCPPKDLPVVNWEYDWEAWPRLQHLRELDRRDDGAGGPDQNPAREGGADA
jgi:hypothetical protein